MRKWEFFIAGTPVAQPRSRATFNRGQARMYTPDNGIVTWKRKIQFCARLYWHGKPNNNAFCVDLEFVFPRPKSITWKTRPMPSIRHIKKPDRDNLDKAVLDALTGIFWIDDCQVCDGRIRKRIASGDESEGVFVSISVLEESVE